ETRLMTSLARPRLYAILLDGFAGFSFLIAGIGLFGGLSYNVAQRRREIGVRTALGATPRDIAGLIMKQGTLMIVAGLGLGFLMAASAGGFLSGFLFGVTPADPATFVVVGAAMLTAGIPACAIPARRAAKVDPIDALRR